MKSFTVNGTRMSPPLRSIRRDRSGPTLRAARLHRTADGPDDAEAGVELALGDAAEDLVRQALVSLAHLSARAAAGRGQLDDRRAAVVRVLAPAHQAVTL